MSVKLPKILIFISLFACSMHCLAAQEQGLFYPWSVSNEHPPIPEGKIESAGPNNNFDETKLSPAVSLIWMIKLYNLTSSGEESCTFHPTCSEYTKEAVAKHGFLIGLIMGAERIMRYHRDYYGYNLVDSNLGYKLYDPLELNDFWF